jgi:transposase-like protein
MLRISSAGTLKGGNTAQSSIYVIDLMTCPLKTVPEIKLENNLNWTHKEVIMPRKHYKPEEVIKLLRLVEIEVGQGRTTGQACKQLGFTEQSYYRWRKEYGGLQINQAKRLKDLEKENSRLKKLVADLSLDKDILNEALRGNY